MCIWGGRSLASYAVKFNYYLEAAAFGMRSDSKHSRPCPFYITKSVHRYKEKDAWKLEMIL